MTRLKILKIAKILCVISGIVTFFGCSANEAKLKTLEDRLSKIETENQNLKKRIQIKEKENGELKSQISSEEQKRTKISGQNRKLQGKIARLQTELKQNNPRTEKMYQVTDIALEQAEENNKGLPKEVFTELKPYSIPKAGEKTPHKYNQADFENILNKILAKHKIDPKEKKEYSNILKNTFTYAHPTVVTKVSSGKMPKGTSKAETARIERMKSELLAKSGSVQVVPYNYVNFQLSPTRAYAYQRNNMWKRGYSRKVNNYFSAQYFLLNEHHSLDRTIATLALSYDRLKRIEANIQTKDQEIEALKVNLKEEQERVHKQLSQKKFQAVFYVQGSYRNNVSKGEALKKLELAVHQYAIEHFNMVMVESYSLITNREITKQKTTATFSVKVQKVQESQDQVFDDYDFEDNRQLTYAIFHFEVSPDTVKSGEKVVSTKKVNLITSNTSDVLIKEIVPITYRNLDSLVFPPSIQTDVDQSVASTRETNKKVKDEIFSIQEKSKRKILKILEDINKAQKEKESFQQDWTTFHQQVVVKREKKTKAVCDNLEVRQKSANVALASAANYGSSGKDGYLYFVIFGESEISKGESADSVTKKLINDLFGKVRNNLQSRYLNQVSEVRNFQLEGDNLFTKRVQEGKIEEVAIVLRTQRRSNLSNYFGIGLMFTVRGQIKIDYRENKFGNVNQCYTQSLKKAKKEVVAAR